MTTRSPESPTRQNTARYELRAASLSLGVGIGLMGVKFVAYFITGSAVIFSDALESIVNVVASLFALGALRLAHRPADTDHPYGHGKVEFLSAGFEGGMILLASLVMIGRAIVALAERQVVESLGTGLWLMSAAMIVNGIMGAYLLRAARRHGSMALEADGRHLLSDAGSSAVALIALFIVQWTGWWAADPIGAIVLAIYIAWLGANLLRKSAAGLMDQQDRADALLLRSILDAHLGPAGRSPTICSYHKLRHRHSGRYHWVDFHIMIPGGMNVSDGHAIASHIEYEIEQSLGEGNATAHIEPCDNPDCLHCIPRKSPDSRQPG